MQNWCLHASRKGFASASSSFVLLSSHTPWEGMFQENTPSQTTKKPRKSFPILHEVEIIYSGPKISESTIVKSSGDSYSVLSEVFDPRKIDYKEIFYVLLLNRAGYCLGVSNIGTGSTTGVMVNIKEIFQLALKANACAIIIAHNHPSGNLEASKADIDLTRKVRLAAELLDMKLLDHLIVTSSGYYSLADEGLMP